MQSVLLVEDNRILRIATRHHLAKAGYQVFIAEDGEQALKSACNDHPDIILLDMILPKLSGLDVLGRLKQDPATAHIPVIVLTGLSRKNEQRLKAQGASAFLEKNQWADNPKALLDTIEEILGTGIASREYLQAALVAGRKPGLIADM